MNRKNILNGALCILLGMAMIISCSKGSSYSSTGTNTGTGTGTNPNGVNMQGMSFSVTTLTVAAGTTVTWTNKDYTTHTVTADDGSFTSGDIASGKTYSRAFTVKGTYAYHCIYHSMMKASIVAQ